MRFNTRERYLNGVPISKVQMTITEQNIVVVLEIDKNEVDR